MNREYLDRLPIDLHRMVAGIESESGMKIEVKIDSSRAGRYFNEPDPLACVVNEYKAQILIPSHDIFPEGAVLHELLHIQRFLVEGVPQLTVCENHWCPALEKVFTQVDNNLEHLVIVPKELIQRPERLDRWIAVMTRVLQHLKSVEIDPADRAFLGIYSWVFIDHVLNHDDLREKYTSALAPLNLMERALEFSRVITPTLSSKESAVRAFVEQFNLSEEYLCLDYFDTRQGTCQQRSLS